MHKGRPRGYDEEREREGIMKSETGRERGKEKERQRTRKIKKHTKRNSLRHRSI